MSETRNSEDNIAKNEFLFPEASTGQILGAVTTFLNEVANETYLNYPQDFTVQDDQDDQGEKKDTWHQFHSDLLHFVITEQHDSKISLSRATELVDLAIQTAGVTAVKLMNESELSHVRIMLRGNSKLRNTYWREKGIQGNSIKDVVDDRVKLLFVHPRELSQIFAQNHGKLVKKFSIDSASNSNERGIVQVKRGTITSKNVVELVMKTLSEIDMNPRIKLNKYQFSAPFVVDSQVAGLVVIGNSELNVGLPQSELHLGSVLKAFLMKGVYPISLDADISRSARTEGAVNSISGSDDEFEKKIQSFEQRLEKLGYRTDSRRGAELRIRRLSREHGGQEYIKQNVERHYHREFFGDSDSDKVIVTRSGVSANQMAIYAAFDLVGLNAKAYEAAGFYYENSEAMNPLLLGRTTKFLEDSRILLITTEPNAPVLDVENYANYRDGLITDFTRLAAGNPDEEYVLVVDKTFDPEFKTPTNYPKNLKIIETLSLSKFQRGDTNTFAGAVLVHDNWLSDDMVDSLLVKSKGMVDEWSRIKKVTLKSMIQEREVVREKIEKIVESDEIKKWAEELGIRIVKGNFFFFVISDKDISLQCKLKSFLKDNLEISYGDSFNLDKTRVTLFEALIKDGKLDASKSILRISPSRNRSNQIQDQEITVIGSMLKRVYGDVQPEIDFDWKNIF